MNNHRLPTLRKGNGLVFAWHNFLMPDSVQRSNSAASSMVMNTGSSLMG